VSNVGLLKLPLLKLSETQAQDLINVCTQTTLGLNSSRITDENIHDSFELKPSHFEIKLQSWQTNINLLAQRAVNYMTGDKTEEYEINAKLYKMLLYTKNGHFKRHQEKTSKNKHMFGTLVVQLPSEYTGGEFITYYKNVLTNHDFGQSSGKLNLN